MPYRRKRRRRRRRRGKKKSLSRAAYSLAKKALNSVDQELKYYDLWFSQTAAVSYASGTVVQAVQLNQIARGDSANQRIGQQAKMRSLYLQLRMEMAAQSTEPTSTIRLAIVLDTEPNQVLPRAENLWQNMGQAYNPIQLYAPLKMDEKYRWKVLYTRQFIMSVTKSPVVQMKKFLRLNFSTRYTGTVGNFGQTSSGALWLFYISDVTEGGTVPTFSGVSRLKFVG